MCQGFPIFVWPNPLINRQRLTESVKFDLTARYCWILLGWRLRYIAILFEVLNYFLRFRAFRFPIYLLIVRHENNHKDLCVFCPQKHLQSVNSILLLMTIDSFTILAIKSTFFNHSETVFYCQFQMIFQKCYQSRILNASPHGNKAYYLRWRLSMRSSTPLHLSF